MKTSTNPFMYSPDKGFIYILEEAMESPETLTLKPGSYYVAGRSGGGSGSVGAGGVGELFENYFNISNTIDATYLIGEGGKTKINGGNGGGDYFLSQYRITVNPNPSNATVNFNAGTIVGNSTLVPTGTSLTYTVSAPGYVTQTETILVVVDRTIDVSLALESCTLTINPAPSDATVTFSIDFGQVTGSVTQTIDGHNDFLSSSYYDINNLVSGNSITVPYGTPVTYSVSKTGFPTVTNTVTVTQNRVISVALGSTLTIVPDPSDATVTLTASGYTQSGNSIIVPNGTSVAYTVSKSGYQTRTDTVTVNSSQSLSVALVAFRTLTISPDPSDATVTLTASGYTQSGNTITVPQGTSVNYSVSKTNYVTQSGSSTVNSNNTISIALNLRSGVTMFETSTPGSYTVSLPRGNFVVTMRGTGGQGGRSTSTSALGGCGGKGGITRFNISVANGTQTYTAELGAVGNNGGAGGTSSGGNGANGGAGARPALWKNSLNQIIGAASGGAGGGGAGGPSSVRYGGGGGGGGGAYALVSIGGTTAVTIRDGASGGAGATSTGAGSAGGNGQGDGSLYGGKADGAWNSGDPGHAAYGGGGNGGTGGGAGGGGGEANNEGYGGAGGGGAGGDTDAGGGSVGVTTGNYHSYTAASNVKTTPTDVSVENSSYGISGNWGMGGYPDGNGVTGYIKVVTA